MLPYDSKRFTILYSPQKCTLVQKVIIGDGRLCRTFKKKTHENRIKMGSRLRHSTVGPYTLYGTGTGLKIKNKNARVRTKATFISCPMFHRARAITIRKLMSLFSPVSYEHLMKKKSDFFLKENGAEIVTSKERQCCTHTVVFAFEGRS